MNISTLIDVQEYEEGNVLEKAKKYSENQETLEEFLKHDNLPSLEQAIQLFNQMAKIVNRSKIIPFVKKNFFLEESGYKSSFPLHHITEEDVLDLKHTAKSLEELLKKEGLIFNCEVELDTLRFNVEWGGFDSDYRPPSTHAFSKENISMFASMQTHKVPIGFDMRLDFFGFLIYVLEKEPLIRNVVSGYEMAYLYFAYQGYYEVTDLSFFEKMENKHFNQFIFLMNHLFDEELDIKERLNHSYKGVSVEMINHLIEIQDSLPTIFIEDELEDRLEDIKRSPLYLAMSDWHDFVEPHLDKSSYDL